MIRTRSMAAGLLLLGLVSLADAIGPLLTDGECGEPMVSVAGLLLVVVAWRGGRMALRGLVGLRVLSAAATVPAFVVAGDRRGGQRPGSTGRPGSTSIHSRSRLRRLTRQGGQR